MKRLPVRKILHRRSKLYRWLQRICSRLQAGWRAPLSFRHRARVARRQLPSIARPGRFMLFCPLGLGSNKIRDQRNGPQSDDVWAAFILDRPPSLNAEIAQGRWQALNLLLQSLVFMHAESKVRSPLVSALQSACVIGAAKRGLLYLQEEGSRRLGLATTVGFGGSVPDAIRESNVMAAAAIRRSKPIVVNIPKDAAVQEELELL